MKCEPGAIRIIVFGFANRGTNGLKGLHVVLTEIADAWIQVPPRAERGSPPLARKSRGLLAMEDVQGPSIICARGRAAVFRGLFQTHSYTSWPIRRNVEWLPGTLVWLPQDYAKEPAVDLSTP